MDYNYYQTPAGPPQPMPPNQISNQPPHQMNTPSMQQHGPNHMMHSPMPPNIRQNIPPGPISHQMQPLQHQQQPNVHHQMQPQQQINYHQMGHPSPHPSHQMSHSNSPQPNFQPPSNQNSNFIGGPMNVQSMHHSRQNHHHQQNHHPQMPHPMNQNPNMPHHHMPQQQFNPSIGRSSPYHLNLLPSEIRIVEFNRRLTTKPRQLSVTPLPIHGHYDETLWWERFANEFFDHDATLTLVIQLDDKPIKYTIGRTLIPRFFRSYFDGGAIDLCINLRNPIEMCSPNVTTLECDRALIVTNNFIKSPNLPLSPGPRVVVHTEGRLSLDFVDNDGELLIKSWKFYTKFCREFVDRSMFSPMMHSTTIEPVTRQGLTRNTLNYLKMCMIIEPLQDIMSLHKQSRQDPSTCLKNFLIDRYNFRSGDDNRTQTNKRRKRKSSANNVAGGSKKSKANANNANINNSNNINNNTTNVVMSPAAPVATVPVTSFPLVSQDVMVVGEPSLMGGDFGDDNERLITRMENSQYDPSASNAGETESSILPPGSVGNNAIGQNVKIQNGEINGSPSLIHQSSQIQLQSVPPVSATGMVSSLAGPASAPPSASVSVQVKSPQQTQSNQTIQLQSQQQQVQQTNGKPQPSIGNEQENQAQVNSQAQNQVVQHVHVKLETSSPGTDFPTSSPSNNLASSIESSSNNKSNNGGTMNSKPDIANNNNAVVTNDVDESGTLETIPNETTNSVQPTNEESSCKTQPDPNLQAQACFEKSANTPSSAQIQVSNSTPTSNSQIQQCSSNQAPSTLEQQHKPLDNGIA